MTLLKYQKVSVGRKSKIYAGNKIDEVEWDIPLQHKNSLICKPGH